jgi:hypothetical protein
VSSTLAGLREELRLELEEETRAKLAEEERAARSAARVAQRAWAASKHTVSGAAKGAAQLGRDLLTRKEARAPERGAGSITVRVRHLHSLLGTYLAVHVTRGEDLLPMDVGNVSDPYVNLWLENEAGEKVNDLGCSAEHGVPRTHVEPRVERGGVHGKRARFHRNVRFETARHGLRRHRRGRRHGHGGDPAARVRERRRSGQVRERFGFLAKKSNVEV